MDDKHKPVPVELAFAPKVSPPVLTAPAVPAEPPSAPSPVTSHRLPWRRLVLAFVVAGLSDFLCLYLEAIPPLQWLLDLFTAGVLFMTLGRNWLLLPGLIAEAVPVVAIFPTWVLVVAAIALWGRIRR